MNNITIRTAGTGDIETLFRWGDENRELWDNPDTKWYSREALADWISYPRDDVLLVAEVDGKLAGMCMNCYLRSWAYCSGLFVDAPFRKLGIGRRLVSSAISILKSKGVRELVFLVKDCNESGVNFYRKISCREGSKLIWMYKTLKNGEKK